MVCYSIGGGFAIICPPLFSGGERSLAALSSSRCSYQADIRRDTEQN